VVLFQYFNKNFSTLITRYEPDELPLLYLAMFGRQSYANITSYPSLLGRNWNNHSTYQLITNFEA